MARYVNWLADKWLGCDNIFVLLLGFGIICIALPWSVIYVGQAVIPADWIAKLYEPAPVWLVLAALFVCWPRKLRN